MAKNNSAVPSNLLERAIAYLSPKKAFERQRFRDAQAVISGYVGARYDKSSTRSYFVASSSADVDTIFDLHTLRGRSRDLVRNTPIATGAIGTYVANVIGSGLSLMCTPDYDALGMTEEEADAWCDKTEKEFAMWAESADCDITRTQNFYGLQGLAFRSMMESGDTFALLPFIPRPSNPYQLVIQLIEADRVDNPNGTFGASSAIAEPTGGTGIAANPGTPAAAGTKNVSGVVIDQYGAPVAYTIANQHPTDLTVGGAGVKWATYQAYGAKTGRRNVLHIFDRLRPGQNRGVPLLAPVIDSLKQIDRYTDAELMAAVISAMFTVFVETPEVGDIDTGFAGEQGTTLVAPPNKGGGKIGMGAGSIVGLAPGEKISFADPKRPSGAFDPFVSAILRQIGVAIGLPYEILIKHFTASYSASRAAILEAWRIFKQRRDFISTQFCNPIYQAWMEEAIALGRIDAPGFFDDPAIRRAYLGCEWVGDAPTQIDPLKEIQAAQIRMETGVSDLPAEIMELRGKNWEDVHRVSVKVKKARVAAGLEAAVTADVLPKVARGEGLDDPTKTDPNIAPPITPGSPEEPTNNGSDLETGDEEK